MICLWDSLYKQNNCSVAFGVMQIPKKVQLRGEEEENGCI